jgi:RimJ/RimL family protein N-acetyltransferase
MRPGRLWSNADMPPLTAPVVPSGALSQVAQPSLRAGDLVLRPWAEGDAAALVAAFADPEIQRWHARTVESRAEAGELIARYQRAWRSETGAHWAITGPEVIGRVALRTVDLEEGCAEIAYWVTPAARGRGAAPRSAIALSGWALGELGLHRLDLEHSVANAASCRVAQKAGFAYEGTRRSAVLHGDGWHDMHLHARIRGDA